MLCSAVPKVGVENRRVDVHPIITADLVGLSVEEAVEKACPLIAQVFFFCEVCDRVIAYALLEFAKVLKGA